MADKVLVIGATGNVGRPLVKNLRRFGIDLRVATRIPVPYAVSHPELDVVLFDFDDPSTYGKAVAGMSKAFIIARSGDDRPQNTVIPLIEEARAAGVSHIVLVTGIEVEQLPGGGLHQVEEHLLGSGLIYTVLRPNWYMQNFNPGFILPMIQKTGTIYLPAGDGRTSFVDTRDVAAVATVALTEEGHLDRIYTLTGSEAISYQDAAAVLSRVCGRPIRYVPTSDEEFRQALLAAGWHGAQADLLVTRFAGVRAGEAARVTGDIRRLLGRDPLRFANFAKENADVWRGGF